MSAYSCIELMGEKNAVQSVAALNTSVPLALVQIVCVHSERQ